MKAHDVAKALTTLARVLKSGPNVELENWSMLQPPDAEKIDESAFAVSVSSLAAISRVSKPHWRKFIQQWKLPVQVKASDSSRDLVGRLFSYLAANPEALRKVHREAAKKNRKASAEMMEALSVLLGSEENDDDGDAK
jgi:hypothetical protein